MSSYKVNFPEFYDELAAFEIESKGFLDGVLVEFSDGRRYLLSFRDQWNVQLDHDASGVTGSGVRLLGVPNLVIVEVVSRANVLGAIDVLIEVGFFDRLGLAE
jgi:hypothetical protein